MKWHLFDLLRWQPNFAPNQNTKYTKYTGPISNPCFYSTTPTHFWCCCAVQCCGVLCACPRPNNTTPKQPYNHETVHLELCKHHIDNFLLLNQKNCQSECLKKFHNFPELFINMLIWQKLYTKKHSGGLRVNGSSSFTYMDG